MRKEAIIFTLWALGSLAWLLVTPARSGAG